MAATSVGTLEDDQREAEEAVHIRLDGANEVAVLTRDIVGNVRKAHVPAVQRRFSPRTTGGSTPQSGMLVVVTGYTSGEACVRVGFVV